MPRLYIKLFLYMSAIFFYILYPVIRLIALLPLPVLFIFSDFLYFLTFYVIGYRKKVVYTNLKNAFPDKPEDDIRGIARRFYKHFADQIIETIKALHISRKEMKKRFRVKDQEMLDELYAANKNIVVVFGHYGNWEWLLTLPLYTKYKILAIHKPLSNKYFSDMVNRLREKYGVRMITMKQSYKTILEYQKRNEQIITYFLGDQTPMRSEINYWTTFLNQDTPVYLGAEKIAQKTGQAVVFFNIQKIRRGYYELETIMITENPEETGEYEITEKHVRLLEEIITDKPEYWLWSHRRWKHRKAGSKQ